MKNKTLNLLLARSLLLLALTTCNQQPLLPKAPPSPIKAG